MRKSFSCLFDFMTDSDDLVKFEVRHCFFVCGALLLNAAFVNVFVMKWARGRHWVNSHVFPDQKELIGVCAMVLLHVRI